MIMNEYQIRLYNNLMALTEKSEVFYYNDWKLDDKVYRGFNYRLASYTDFCEPDALNCRGIMFEVSEEGQNAELIRLASHPFSKFHNLYECPFTMDLDLSTIVEITDKADGSLISTYAHTINKNTIDIRLKSKGSLSSDQAIAAMRWVDKKENYAFMQELRLAEHMGYTVICEWCSPENRIVLPYMEPHLKVLGIRSRLNGEYLNHESALIGYLTLTASWVELTNVENPIEFVATIPDMQNIEGYVVQLESGQRIKIKTTWYLALHHTKDSINTPRRLYEAVLEEATDDMRSLFHDDPLAIKLIADMETFVEEKYNHLVDVVERFYERNKDLERKDYAILGQKELNKLQFGLAMSKYLGKDFSYKEIMKKRWKEFGLKDEKEE